MSVDSWGKLVDILLVEDNEGDVRLTREVLKDARVRNKLAVCSDGEDALDYLRRRGRYANASLPDLILLDLNLPLCDGREVLAQIKDDPILRLIPVVVLTTSASEQDVLRSYNLHANCYITKPVDLAQFIRVVQTIQDFWLEVVKLPSHIQR